MYFLKTAYGQEHDNNGCESERLGCGSFPEWLFSFDILCAKEQTKMRQQNQKGLIFQNI